MKAFEEATSQYKSTLEIIDKAKKDLNLSSLELELIKDIIKDENIIDFTQGIISESEFTKGISILADKHKHIFPNKDDFISIIKNFYYADVYTYTRLRKKLFKEKPDLKENVDDIFTLDLPTSKNLQKTLKSGDKTLDIKTFNSKRKGQILRIQTDDNDLIASIEKHILTRSDAEIKPLGDNRKILLVKSNEKTISINIKREDDGKTFLEFPSKDFIREFQKSLEKIVSDKGFKQSDIEKSLSNLHIPMIEDAIQRPREFNSKEDYLKALDTEKRKSVERSARSISNNNDFIKDNSERAQSLRKALKDYYENKISVDDLNHQLDRYSTTKDLNLPIILTEDELTQKLFRYDLDPYSFRKQDTNPHSHIKENGSLGPANNSSSITPYEHIAGTPREKGRSSFSSFTTEEAMKDRFLPRANRGYKIELDLEKLYKDIQSGAVKDVLIIPKRVLLKNALNKISSRFSTNEFEVFKKIVRGIDDLSPDKIEKRTPSIVESLKRDIGADELKSIRYYLHIVSSREFLIQGEIPRRYFQVYEN